MNLTETQYSFCVQCQQLTIYFWYALDPTFSDTFVTLYVVYSSCLSFAIVAILSYGCHDLLQLSLSFNLLHHFFLGASSLGVVVVYFFIPNNSIHY